MGGGFRRSLSRRRRCGCKEEIRFRCVTSNSGLYALFAYARVQVSSRLWGHNGEGHRIAQHTGITTANTYHIHRGAPGHGQVAARTRGARLGLYPFFHFFFSQSSTYGSHHARLHPPFQRIHARIYTWTRTARIYSYIYHTHTQKYHTPPTPPDADTDANTMYR